MRKPLTLTADAWGNVIVARALGNHGTFIAKLDKEGNVLWERILGSEEAAANVPRPALTALVTEDPGHDDRDSVEPLMLDPELEELQNDLRGPSRLFRGLGIAAMLAALFAFSIAGGAALRHSAASNSIRPAAASTGIRGVMMDQADRAVADAEPVITVDDTVDAMSHEVDAPPVVEEPAVEEPTVDEPTVDEPTVEEPTVEQPVADETAAAPAPATAPPKAAEPVAAPTTEAPATPSEPAEEAPAPVTAATLRKDALALLNAGKSDEAAPVALQLVAAAPSDAFSYLILGAAHQSAGRIAEAATAYRTCVTFAKHGDLEECRALAR